MDAGLKSSVTKREKKASFVCHYFFDKTVLIPRYLRGTVSAAVLRCYQTMAPVDRFEAMLIMALKCDSWSISGGLAGSKKLTKL